MNELQKQYLFLTLIGLTVLSLLIFVLFPAVDDILVQKRDLSDLGAQISMNAEASSSTLEDGNEFEEQKAEVERIYNKAIMTDSNQLDFVEFLENLARQEIRTQITFNPTERMLIKRNPVTPFTITTMSSLQEFVDYLADIESSEYYILIRNITIKPLRISAQTNITTIGKIEGFISLE